MSTREQLIDLAQREIQTKGYSAFSYADLSAQIGISKASIHHHFPAKSDLGREVARRYWQEFEIALNTIAEQSEDALESLQRYAQIFINGLRDQRVVCAGMMLASDQESLPENMLAEVHRFLALNEAWLEQVLAAGRQDNTLSFSGTAREAASTVFTALEGAMLISKADGNTERLELVTDWLLNSLRAK